MTNAPRLYIFPHAGGSATFYVPFSKAFSTGIKRVAVQYPDTQSGQGRTAVPNIQAFADNICRILSSAPDAQAPSEALSRGPIAFFGHSMGALVAFEVARRFESNGDPITALFVSACSAPGVMRDEYFSDLSDDELVTFLVDLSGTDPKVLDDKEFVDMVLPALRGYYNAIAGYTCAAGATVSCPIYAFAGTDDGLARYENMSAWSAHTMSEFAVRVFDGDHFYFAKHLSEVAREIEMRFFEAALRRKRGERG
jgi:surfactin synthase thioesterase subunit